MSLKHNLKTFRKRLRNKLNSRIKGSLKENKVLLPQGGCVRLEIKGKNNTVIFPETITDDSFYSISIIGNNNFVEIKSASTNNVKLKICGGKIITENCVFKIGAHTTIQSGDFNLHERNSSITIGENCMVSFNLVAWCTDMHSIFTQGSQVPTNIGKSITIGNHVWIGKDVHIAKNTVIPDNCIVGWQSNVASKFTEENCVIAGNPARVVKQNIDWSPACVDDILYA